MRCRNDAAGSELNAYKQETQQARRVPAGLRGIAIKPNGYPFTEPIMAAG